MDALLGMAEVAAWADAPARAIGRFDVRKPPKSLDEMWAVAANEKEREAIRIALFGSIMDVVDRYLPDKERHAPVRKMCIRDRERRGPVPGRGRYATMEAVVAMCLPACMQIVMPVPSARISDGGGTTVAVPAGVDAVPGSPHGPVPWSRRWSTTFRGVRVCLLYTSRCV